MGRTRFWVTMHKMSLLSCCYGLKREYMAHPRLKQRDVKSVDFGTDTRIGAVSSSSCHDRIAAE